MSPQTRILIIDDSPDNVSILFHTLQRAGYSQIMGQSDSERALDSIRDFKPDLIILDLMMAHVSGFDILRSLPSITNDPFLPVLVITAAPDDAVRKTALSLGATDFLGRPHQPFDVVLRARNLLQMRALQLELQERNRLLEREVAERTQGLQDAQSELKAAQLDVIERLARAGEHHDDDTGAHTRRVAQSCQRIAHKLGLSNEQVELLFRAAPLHDVGKIGVSDAILLKPARLTTEEFDKMKTHCEIGAHLLSDGRSDFLETARLIALCHHERFDGTGYPQGLKGEEIPLEGRIVAVADVYDALTHDRPYKTAWSVEAARAEIASQAGKQFDPNVVQAFLELDS
ncbi:cyclic di-GMP phosphodiesterase response regulator RpfG [Abditibacteriota bacterium]|nr:cyclic di-GMP phosphodiesterase response regulator RpfG [Abditibacteriota bacterium]